ncbi:ydjO [Escherichia coli]|nr:ydjO [Escherichia coli]
MMSLWDALRMNMMISYQELVRTFPNSHLHFDTTEALIFSLRAI